jgi:excisionase family DNA binding protein
MAVTEEIQRDRARRERLMQMAQRENDYLRPLLASVNQACQMLGIKRTKLYGLMAAGSIRAVKIGGSVKIPMSEIDRIVAEGA